MIQVLDCTPRQEGSQEGFGRSVIVEMQCSFCVEMGCWEEERSRQTGGKTFCNMCSCKAECELE